MLHELQEKFFNSVYQPEDAAPGFVKPGNLSVHEQLAIYRESILGGMSKALAEVYPVCHQLVGGDFFNHMADAYVRQYVSTTADITCYGAQLADFIEHFEAASSVPYLADVARLEWAWHYALNAPDEPVLCGRELNQVAGSDYARIQLQLQGSATLLRSPYPVLHIWQVHQEDYEGEIEISLDEGGIDLLVWRCGQELHIEPLDEVQTLLVQQLQQHATLEQAFITLLQHAPHTNLASLLTSSLEQGWFSSLCTKP